MLRGWVGASGFVKKVDAVFAKYLKLRVRESDSGPVYHTCITPQGFVFVDFWVSVEISTVGV